MKKLNLKHCFMFARILKAANLQKEISEFATQTMQNGNKNVEEVGFNFVLTLISSAGNVTVEKQIYELYADIKDFTVEEAETVELEVLKNDINTIIKENNLKSFFSSVQKLM